MEEADIACRGTFGSWPAPLWPPGGSCTRSSFAGTVLDPSGAPITGAKVISTDADRKTNNAAKTDSSGRYLFRSLSPGNYSIRVEAAGFEPFGLHNIEIEVNGSLSADSRLQLLARSGKHSGIWEASSSAQVDDPTVGLTLSRELINDLPLVNRNPFDLRFSGGAFRRALGNAYGNAYGNARIRDQFCIRRQP